MTKYRIMEVLSSSQTPVFMCQYLNETVDAWEIIPFATFDTLYGAREYLDKFSIPLTKIIHPYP